MMLLALVIRLNRQPYLLSESLGIDTFLLAEHFIHPNCAKLAIVDTWNSAPALAALTVPGKPGLRASLLALNDGYARSSEYIDIMKGLWTMDDFSFSGNLFDIKQA